MATDALLDELAAETYKGLDAQAKSNILNEWHTEWIPCPLSALRIMFDEILLDGRVQVARDKGTLDDDFWARWLTLIEMIKSKLNGFIDFSTKPIEFAEMIATLESMGVITDPEPTWLYDLGRKQHTLARMLYHYDVTPEIVTAIEDLWDLKDKIAAERTASLADYEKRLVDLETATLELNKTEGGVPTTDKNYVPPWLAVVDPAPVVIVNP
jgi:hypothetical protein